MSQSVTSGSRQGPHNSRRRAARFVLLTAAVAGCSSNDRPFPAASTPDASSHVAAPEGRPPEFPAEQIAPKDELARRLALLLWNTEPDSSVLAAVGAATITRDRIARVAQDMLADSRARNGVAAFFRWWLLSDALATLNKADPERVLTPELRASMSAEAPALGVHLTLETSGTFTDLLTAPYTFVDERLSRHYGLTSFAGPGTQRIPYPPDQHRIGLLTGAGVLATFSSLGDPSWPAKRGWLVTDMMLCTPVIRSFLEFPPIDRDRSLRQQMLSFTDAANCQGCHAVLNSPGFAFIGFDSFGRWRPEPGHRPGETEGWIPKLIMPDEPNFEGPDELARLLASREETSRCFVRQWLQFAIDRSVVVRSEIPPAILSSIEAAHGEFKASGFVMRSLLLSVTRTDAFLRR